MIQRIYLKEDSPKTVKQFPSCMEPYGSAHEFQNSLLQTILRQFHPIRTLTNHLSKSRLNINLQSPRFFQTADYPEIYFPTFHKHLVSSLFKSNAKLTATS